MKKYYTAEVSEEVRKALQTKNCPYASKIDMGFTVPDLVDRIPTYAEILDWLKEQDFYISIHETLNQGFTVVSFDNDRCECGPHYKVGKSIREALDQMILLALNFIEDGNI